MTILLRRAGDIAAAAVLAIARRIAAHVAAAGGSTVHGITLYHRDGVAFPRYDIDIAV